MAGEKRADTTGMSRPDRCGPGGATELGASRAVLGWIARARSVSTRRAGGMYEIEKSLLGEGGATRAVGRHGDDIGGRATD